LISCGSQNKLGVQRQKLSTSDTVSTHIDNKTLFSQTQNSTQPHTLGGLSINSRVLLYSRVASYPLHRYAKQSHFSGRSRSHPPAPRPRPTPAQHATTLMECPPCRCNRCGAGRASSVDLAILGRHDALDQPAEHWEHGDDQRENDRHRAHRHCKMRRETGAHSAEAEAEALKCAYLNAP
jgi:hypothetical protein